MAGHRVLLFGASGFLGRAVGAALDRDQRVGTVIRAGRPQSGQTQPGQTQPGQTQPGQTQSGQAQPGQRPDVGWVSHDLLTAGPGELAALVRRARPDAVISCAGRLSGDTVQLTEMNVLVTARLIEAVASQAPTARLVVLGSAAEYGPAPHGRLIAEDSPARPAAAYGITRLASTQLVDQAARDERLDAIVLRVFNPIGPRVPPENMLGRAVAAMRAALRTGADAIVLGPLGAYRDFVDVRDVAAAVAAAALAEQAKERVLNVGSGRAVLCRDLVRLLAEIAGFTGRLVETRPPPDRSSSVDWSAADVSRIERALGWVPVHDLRTSVEASWRCA
jgi:NDP-hexose 4-ketoreductase